ncbi:uncharacterized protein LOC123661396 [Melitaea cinxia]|uniref:uncharacterized protein LOC123661396 n=1 Tax=Melitaea cinxia TaxID=113334 RepID=UPI001E271181|nr:uncharacterized protein LOC123661396 [Melitaea cinxia]
MELLSFVKEVLQNVAERAASYRFGQTMLRCMDRGLWIVEKSARWTVPPPPLDQEERPQPELIRPLPWVFFLALLIVLRVARESISFVNLAFGKPPLRSADVVAYIQSKRRYLRTLKYQGTRVSRARSSAPAREGWGRRLRALVELTMCFRPRYGNNNTQLSGDEVLVVKKKQRGRETDTGNSMERLIEKMMVDIDADSDDSSCYTLTNVTNPRSDRSDYNTESDQETHQSKNNEENSNNSLDENYKTPSPESPAYEDTDEIEIPNDVYRKPITTDVKEISIDFIRNEMGTHIEQIIKSQHKIDKLQQ